jgi:uncharacterized cofD-like protein
MCYTFYNSGMTRIVTIGGGTGTFVVLSAVKTLPNVEATAIVSSADDGGATGRLRDAYGSLPIGDARQALVALAEDGTLMRQLFTYRFDKGDIKGHNLGNLFLTALSDLFGSEAMAIEEASRILRVTGRVLSATEQPTVLVATLVDGKVIRGEHAIDNRDSTRARIAAVSLEESAPIAPAAADAIQNADFIILGPGDLYTSTIAALLPLGMKEAIAASPAKLLYFTNLFTKAGETNGYGAKEFAVEIERYAGRRPDRVFVHDGSFPEEALSRYAVEGEYPLSDNLQKDDASVTRLPLASVHLFLPSAGDALRRSLIRHDPEKIAAALRTLIV